MPEAKGDLALLEQAAVAAGEVALGHFRADPKVWEKDAGQGPVTEADLAVDVLLRETLTRARPGYGWLSEESTDDGARSRTARVFIVDPIDGTRAFIQGSKDWSVSLAIAEHGRVTAGVVHLPARGETYRAALGQGAWLGPDRLSASSVTDLSAACALVAKPQFRTELWPGGAPPCSRAFRSSLAWRLCLVAAARFDLMLTLRDAWEWDVAAGSLIAAEAGAEVTDGVGGQLVFNRDRPLGPGVIAAPLVLHRELLTLRTGSALPLH